MTSTAPRTYRSGVNSLLRWMGAALVLSGLVVFAVFPLLYFSLTRSPGAVVMLIGLPVFTLAGTAMTYIGSRRRIAIGGDHVTWRSAVGPPLSIRFADIAHIEVPTGRTGPRAVRLHSTDGRIAEIGALTMSSTEGNHPDRGYRAAAEALVGAHAQWWARAQGRAPFGHR